MYTYYNYYNLAGSTGLCWSLKSKFIDGIILKIIVCVYIRNYYNLTDSTGLCWNWLLKSKLIDGIIKFIIVIDGVIKFIIIIPIFEFIYVLYYVEHVHVL